MMLVGDKHIQGIVLIVVVVFIAGFGGQCIPGTDPGNGSGNREPFILEVDAVTHVTGPVFYGFGSPSDPKHNAYGTREQIDAGSYTAELSGPGVTNGSGGAIRKKVFFQVVLDGESDWWLLDEANPVSFTVTGQADVWAVTPLNTKQWLDFAEGTLTVTLNSNRDIVLDSSNQRINFDPMVRDHLDSAELRMASRILEKGKWSIYASGEGFKLDSAQPYREKVFLWLDVGPDSDWYCLESDSATLNVELDDPTTAHAFILESWSGDYNPIRSADDNQGSMTLSFTPQE